jgi:hypothetical protein
VGLWPLLPLIAKLYGPLAVRRNRQFSDLVVMRSFAKPSWSRFKRGRSPSALLDKPFNQKNSSRDRKLFVSIRVVRFRNML